MVKTILHSYFSQNNVNTCKNQHIIPEYLSAYHDLLVLSPQDFLGELVVGLDKDASKSKGATHNELIQGGSNLNYMSSMKHEPHDSFSKSMPLITEFYSSPDLSYWWEAGSCLTLTINTSSLLSKGRTIGILLQTWILSHTKLHTIKL